MHLEETDATPIIVDHLRQGNYAITECKHQTWIEGAGFKGKAPACKLCCHYTMKHPNTRLYTFDHEQYFKKKEKK